MSSFIIKLIAIITMTIDHVNDIFYRESILNVIGRIAFPLFCFQIVVGYAKTKSFPKYIIRMIGFAIISQIPYSFFMNTIGIGYSLNVLFSLSIGLVAMYVYDLRISNNNGRFLITNGKRKDYTAKI